MVLDPPGTQLSHVSSPAKFVEVLDLLCDIKIPPAQLKATEVNATCKTRQGCHQLAGVRQQPAELSACDGTDFNSMRQIRVSAHCEHLCSLGRLFLQPHTLHIIIQLTNFGQHTVLAEHSLARLPVCK